MTRSILLAAGPAIVTAHVAAQTSLYAIRSNGELVCIDPATGAGTELGGSGLQCTGAGVIHGLYNGDVMHIIRPGPAATTLTPIGSCNGTPWSPLAITGVFSGYSISALAGSYPDFYVILRADGFPPVEQFARVHWDTGVCTFIGDTTHVDLTSIAIGPSGTIYALGTDFGGALYRVNPSTGMASGIGLCGFGSDVRTLEFLPDGTLLACGDTLFSLDPATGAATPIGLTGFSDIRGLAAATGCFGQPRNGTCYPNCDDCTCAPCLNVLDFACFLTLFANGLPYANCDHSTIPPLLNVQDFQCFLNKFAAGCSSC